MDADLQKAATRSATCATLSDELPPPSCQKECTNQECECHCRLPGRVMRRGSSFIGQISKIQGSRLVLFISFDRDECDEGGPSRSQCVTDTLVHRYTHKDFECEAREHGRSPAKIWGATNHYCLLLHPIEHVRVHPRLRARHHPLHTLGLLDLAALVSSPALFSTFGNMLGFMPRVRCHASKSSSQPPQSVPLINTEPRSMPDSRTPPAPAVAKKI